MNNLKSENTLLQLRDDIRAFVRERRLEKTETPKNLATALSVEAGELLEPFQWLLTGDVIELGPHKLVAVQKEMADVLIYLVALADSLNTDLIEVARQKMHDNRIKHPAPPVQIKAIIAAD